MEQPKISVIIPTYNRANKIKRALASVKEQTIRGFELIIVDDASIDETEEVVNQLLPDLDFPVHYGKLDTNSGPSKARNVGVGKAHGKYITFLDSDDCWDKNFLNYLSFFLDTHTDIDLVYCDTHLRDDRNNVLFTFSLVPYDYNKLLDSSGAIATGAFMFRKCIWYKYGGFREDLKRAEDFEWQLRIGEHCKFARYPAVLHHYYRSSDGLILTSNGNKALIKYTTDTIGLLRKQIKSRLNAKK